MTEERAAEIVKAKAVAAAIEAEFKLKENKGSVNNARTILLLVGIFELLLGLWQAFGSKHSMIGLYVDGGLAAIFFVLYFSSKSYPLPSLIAGLLIYLLPQIFNHDDFFQFGFWWVDLENYHHCFVVDRYCCCDKDSEREICSK